MLKHVCTSFLIIIFRVYYTKEALHQHRHIHSNSREPYQCHLCEARFLTYAR